MTNPRGSRRDNSGRDPISSLRKALKITNPEGSLFCQSLFRLYLEIRKNYNLVKLIGYQTGKFMNSLIGKYHKTDPSPYAKRNIASELLKQSTQKQLFLVYYVVQSNQKINFDKKVVTVLVTSR